MSTFVNKVYRANPPGSGSMGSLGNASMMLIQQYRFPDTYDKNEVIISADSDRCFQWDFQHARQCFEKHTGTGELGFQNWLRQASDQEVMNFIIDILKADKGVEWTGYRILGTVNRGNGYDVWTLELFAKNPKSNTQVYSGLDAPNVKPRDHHDKTCF